MVTHDRYFLDSVTNRIIELDKGKSIVTTKNTQDFWREKLSVRQVPRQARESVRAFFEKKLNGCSVGQEQGLLSRKHTFKDMKI